MVTGTGGEKNEELLFNWCRVLVWKHAKVLVVDDSDDFSPI